MSRLAQCPRAAAVCYASISIGNVERTAAVTSQRRIDAATALHCDSREKTKDRPREAILPQLPGAGGLVLIELQVLFGLAKSFLIFLDLAFQL